MLLESIPLSALSLRLSDVLPVQSYGCGRFISKNFRFLPKTCFYLGFGVADDSLIDSPACEMTDITGPDRDDVSGRADYDRYGDD